MNQHPSAEPTWKAPVAVANVPETGQHIDLVADAAVRETVSKVADLVALPRLQAEFDLTRQGPDGVHVVGRVMATVVQNCVVTLDPVESEVDEPIDLVFMPPQASPAGAHDIEIEADDLPETLRDGAVDLGALATEFLLLGIDPYPRKPGVAFEAPVAEGDPSSHPFAALEALKKDGGGR